MKYRTLAVLAFAGVLAVSGTALAKTDPNDPFKTDPFDELQRVRQKHGVQDQNQNQWPTFKPGTRPERPRPRSGDIRRPSDQKGTKPDRRPPKVDGKKPSENDSRSNNDRRTPPPQRPRSRDRRPEDFRRQQERRK